MVQGEHNSLAAKKVWVYTSLGPVRVGARLLVILSGVGRLWRLIEIHVLKFGKTAARVGSRRRVTYRSPRAP